MQQAHGSHRVSHTVTELIRRCASAAAHMARGPDINRPSTLLWTAERPVFLKDSHLVLPHFFALFPHVFSLSHLIFYKTRFFLSEMIFDLKWFNSIFPCALYPKFFVAVSLSVNRSTLKKEFGKDWKNDEIDEQGRKAQSRRIVQDEITNKYFALPLLLAKVRLYTVFTLKKRADWLPSLVISQHTFVRIDYIVFVTSFNLGNS